MRIPYTIRRSVIKVYEPSAVSLKLIGELLRNVRSEDLYWDSELCPSLVTYCIRAIAKNFENRPVLDEVYHADKDNLYELLSTDLPLKLTIPLIDVEDYWKRCYLDKYGPWGEGEIRNYKWKNIFIEKYTADMIEHLQPQYNDEDTIEDLTVLFNPYVRTLHIGQLQAWKPPLTMSPEDIPEIYPNDHIDFLPIFKKLENIVELEIAYTMNKVGETFNWNMVKLSVDDCKRLGIAILQLKFIKKLRLHRSKIEDLHIQMLLQNLAKNTTLLELDLSHCAIGNKGAVCLGKFLTVHPVLTKLCLCNNLIGGLGGIGIGYALTHETCCPLEELDVRLNPLGHEGTMGILRAIVRQNTINIKTLSLAGCLFENETSLRVAQMIGLNQSIERLDISNNWFDKEAADTLLERIQVNEWLHWLDLRDTDIPDEVVQQINKYLIRNRSGLDEIEESTVSDEGESEKEEVIVDDHFGEVKVEVIEPNPDDED